jgi:hypothetical protein
MLPLARFFLVLGVIFLVIGGLLILANRLGLQLGRLPGDLRIERGSFTCLIGLGTSLLLSIVLTILLNVIARFFNK